MKRRFLFFVLFVSMAATLSCTDLEERYYGNLTTGQVTAADSNVDALLNNLNSAVNVAFQSPFGDVISLSEITTDELIVPTRGPDWGDNGIWRQLHQHRWDGDHTLLTGCFNDLGGVVFASTNILQFNPSPQQEAYARFYRAWAMYWLLDFFNQVPYRDPGESTLIPARVRKGLDAWEYIVNEINSIMPNLPEGPTSKLSKNAARVFLMKCYLNKGVYANRQSPTLDLGDLNKVIALADEVINSNQYTFSNNYFDNFAPDNANIGKENIFTQENIGGVNNGSTLFYYSLFPLHYASSPYGGFNGMAALSNLYDKLEVQDLRKGQAYESICYQNTGHRINVGFLIGQQYNLSNDAPLITDSGIPVSFTKEVGQIETDSNLEITGIRPQKYSIDCGNFPWENDWVYFRLPDVLLMKAEAILRGGTATNAGIYGSTPLELVNSIRQHPSRSASKLTSINLNTLLDERARELWLECWRRQDLIRFGKFLEPFQEKDYVSDPKYLLFAIPNQQLTVNEYLEKNPGY